MSETNPATPAQAATPGSGEQNQPPSANSTPGTQNGAGNQSEGTVTISTKEYGELQRAKARSLAFDRRREITGTSRNNPHVNREQQGNEAPGVADALAAVEARADAAERRAMQLEVKDKVRELLAKPQYATLPQSTRELILKNPAMLSEADNIDEAILDIEDFVIEQIGIPVVQNNASDNNSPRPANVPGHETPSTNASAPAPVRGNETEDISKLTGSARSRAIVRNKLRAGANGGQQ